MRKCYSFKWALKKYYLKTEYSYKPYIHSYKLYSYSYKNVKKVVKIGGLPLVITKTFEI